MLKPNSSVNKYVLKGIEHIGFALNIYVPVQEFEIETINSLLFNLFD